MNKNQVVFKPIVLENEVFVEKSASPKFYKNLEKVLTFYQVNFLKNEDGTILVDQELKNDTDLCWNYTTKANDSIWISEH